MSVEPSKFAHMPQVLEQKRNISGIGIGRFPRKRAFLLPNAVDARNYQLSNFREYLKTEIQEKGYNLERTRKTKVNGCNRDI
jgi:hypothetical protein